MSGDSFKAEIRATPSEAEGLFRILRGWIAEHILPPDAFSVELLCREAVANAIEHGCDRDCSKRVKFGIELEGDEVSCRIEDEGDGFALSACDWFAQAGPGERGRGIKIMGHYADQVLFEEGGKVVRFIKRIKGGTER